MDRLDQLAAFIAVIETGGFSAAARQTGTPQPAISKAVGALEKRLGVILLNRSTRSVTPTEQGRLLHERARPLVEEMREVEADVAQSAQGLSGLIRISAPATFGRLHVLPLLPEILAANPGLEIEIVLADGLRDMVEDGIDLALRVGSVEEPDLVAHPIARTPLVCVGSRAYLDAHGTPREPSDLARHNCLIYGRRRGADDWPFCGPGGPHRVKVSGNLRSNNADAIRAGVLAGVGLGMMTRASLSGELDRPDVQTVLDEFIDVALDVHVVWPRRRFVPAKVRHLTKVFEKAMPPRLGVRP